MLGSLVGVEDPVLGPTRGWDRDWGVGESRFDSSDYRRYFVKTGPEEGRMDGSPALQLEGLTARFIRQWEEMRP